MSVRDVEYLSHVYIITRYYKSRGWVLLTLNLRRGTSTLFFGKPEWSYTVGSKLTPKQAEELLKGKKVLLLVHGFNVSDPDDAYATVALNMGHMYDYVVGVHWPGSRFPLFFRFAQKRADKAGQILASAIRHIDAVFDIEGHSLGCHVTLESLKYLTRVRNVILAAPAVDNEVIQFGYEYEEAMSSIKACMVAYSRYDSVLAKAYRIADWDNALGLTGPEDPSQCPKTVLPVDLSEFVKKHSQYKKEQKFYEEWTKLLTSQE